jgi:hypothetical protein
MHLLRVAAVMPPGNDEFKTGAIGGTRSPHGQAPVRNSPIAQILWLVIS